MALNRAFPDDLKGGGAFENGLTEKLEPFFVIKPCDGEDQESGKYEPESPRALLGTCICQG